MQRPWRLAGLLAVTLLAALTLGPVSLPDTWNSWWVVRDAAGQMESNHELPHSDGIYSGILALAPVDSARLLCVEAQNSSGTTSRDYPLLTRISLRTFAGESLAVHTYANTGVGVALCKTTTGFVLAGHDGGIGRRNRPVEHVWLLGLSPTGDSLWFWRTPTTVQPHPAPIRVAARPGGGIVAALTTGYGSTPHRQVTLLWFSADGRLEREQFLTSGIVEYAQCIGLATLPDGTCVALLGERLSVFTLLALDDAGRIFWRRRIESFDWINQLAALSDGTLLIVGSVQSPHNRFLSTALKCTPDGEPLWNVSTNGPSVTVRAIVEASDHRLFLAGEIRHRSEVDSVLRPQGWLGEIAAHGDSLVSHTIQSPGQGTLNAVAVLPDRRIILAGGATSHDSGPIYYLE